MEANSTTWQGYIDRFDTILKQENPEEPYNNPAFSDYTKLNKSRVKRWLKTGEVNTELSKIIKAIDKRQTWYLILEPWCGDAAHSSPFIFRLAELNPNITLKIIWRDTAPLLIDKYLTNGRKSIPKLIIRGEKEKDLHTWGPRPKECQTLYNQLKEKGAEFDKIKIALQNWYNKDKGKELQKEFIELLK